jgi:uncharacterized damage-inducible protein DinB
MTLRNLAGTLAAYNRWVNTQIYAAAAALPDEARRRPLGGPFDSLHGTLAHLIVGDRVWLQRFRREALTPPAPGADPFPTFEALHAARVEVDVDIDALVETLDDEFGDRPFTFTSIVYRCDRTLPGWAAVLHFFNHQTHHRGQALTLLRQLGSRAPIVLDLPFGPWFDSQA